ncbi:MAG TPA: histidine kinase dimerization/phospho-acceptor domain-containing protein, partial [Aggregatilineales bacterium]|nr:histidine kinase dimerization/phospho-acceptor domain-containing protein [Aggregatilineales bacterium]
ATQRSQGAFSRIELRNDPRLTRSLAYSVVPYFTGENYDDALGFGLVIVSADFNARSVGSDVLSTQLGRDLQELIGEMGGLLLATMAVVVVIALLFAQRVVAPIRTVTRYAAIMEQRRLIDTEISVLKRKRGRSEVNQLARTFGTMTETVQQREAEIAELLSQTDEALARRVKELATLEEIGQQLTATLDLSLVFDFATRVLVERTAAEGVHLVVFPPDEESEPHIAIAGRVLSPEESSEALRIPLKHGDEKIGHFELFAEGYVFDENEQSFARQLADWVSVAINNARLFEQIQEQQRQLEITNKEVTEANRLKSEFLAVMSHELRTPLNAIIGFLGIMLMSGQLNERNTFLAGRARANSDRLLRLINDILDISRIEAGR